MRSARYVGKLYSGPRRSWPAVHGLLLCFTLEVATSDNNLDVVNLNTTLAVLVLLAEVSVPTTCANCGLQGHRPTNEVCEIRRQAVQRSKELRHSMRGWTAGQDLLGPLYSLPTYLADLISGPVALETFSLIVPSPIGAAVARRTTRPGSALQTPTLQYQIVGTWRIA
jgi:hypothetical protein